MINKKRLINTFLELVKIDSPSEDEEKMALAVSEKLKKLGAKVKRDSFGNVIGQFDGKGTPLMLNAHLDTVEPGRNIKPIVTEDTIKTDGSTVLGSDPKAGVSIILEALTTIREAKTDHPPLDIVFTREEETSLGGAINLDYSLLRAKEGIVFDGDEEVWKIFISSPTYYAIDATITGRSAHAGVEPEKGLSAIMIAAEILTQFPQGRIDKETTANIGLISGGSVRNAVPETVTLEGEIRSRNPKTLKKILAEVEKAFKDARKKYPQAAIELQLLKDFEGFVVPKNHSLIKRATSVLKQLKLPAELKDSGGGSDANIFFTHGIDVIIVGTGVYDAHTTRENLVISQMVEAANFCEQFILSASK